MNTNILLDNSIYQLRVLGFDNKNEIQSLCEECEDYYKLEREVPPSVFEGNSILKMLPPKKDYYDKYVFGVYNEKEKLVSVIDIVKDYPSEKEWMLGLMLVDPNERNIGLGKEIHDFLSSWTSKLGGNKLRIAVVEQNKLGRRFWDKIGYKELRRTKAKVGTKENKIIVMNYHI